MSSGISPKKEYPGKAVDQSINNLKPLEDYFEKKPNLNNEQKHAASSPEKNILVLAGAGCGKTKTIIARAEYLIENHSPANKVNILTFTRKASAQKGKDDKNDLYFLATLEDDLIENEDHRYLDSENQFSESKLTKSRNKPSTSVDLE